ncbi:ankyrin repeat-containing domain protein [Gloeopeniophorella convolvens]|nr:ankyrin repeat-containing domain protein [Gloeopeniophorella convolvens]
MVYFYCDFQDTAKQGVHGILLSFIIQLSEQSDTYLNILSSLYSSLPEGSPKPSDDTLVDWLKCMLTFPGNGIRYIIMDALDECPSSGVPMPRTGVTKLLKELWELSRRVHNLRLCVMSRFDHDIGTVLKPLASHSMSLEAQAGQAQDMTDYISSVIDSDSRMKEWDPEIKDLVTRVLSRKAHGMFRYVHCQLETLSDCQPADIPAALDALPESLEGTYERILRHIPETKWKHAHLLFQSLMFAARPLSLVEAAEILAIDFDSDPIPTLRPEKRPNNPEAAIMSTCSTLVIIVKGDQDSSRIVQFAHMSVQEYLTSDRLARAADGLSHYHVIPGLAHSLLAQVCISSILFDGQQRSQKTESPDSPLSDYSNRYWASHARFDGVSLRITAALEHLLDPQRPNFDDWVGRMHLDDCPVSAEMVIQPICDDRDDHDSSPGSPLYYSALLGLRQLADHLVKSNPQHLNAPHGKSGAPLQAASALGHLDVVRTLLGHGATPNGRGGHYGNALCAASVNGHIDIVHVLLDHKARVNDVGARNTTALSMAVQMGNRDVTRVLLARGASADLASSTAVSKGDFKSAELLLECGADVDGRDGRGSTALQVASSTGSLGTVQFLLDHGAGVNAPPGSSGTALHCAVSQGHYDVAEVLIENAADINGPGIEGRTSLQALSSKGHLGAVEWLLRHGGDPNARIGEEMNPLEAASSHGHIDVVQLLVEHGVNVRSDGAAALLHASSNGHLGVARYLLEKGADPNETGRKSERPLWGASANGHLKIVQLLLERQATIDATSGEKGETALHAASRRGQLQVVKLLIDKGAYIDGPGHMRWSTTALYVASRGGHLEVCALRRVAERPPRGGAAAA